MSSRFEYTIKGKDRFGNDYMLSVSSPNPIEWDTDVELTWEEFDDE